MGVVIFAGISLYDLVAGQFPKANLPTIEDYVHWLDWRIWLLIALTLALVGILEGTFNYIKRIKVASDSRINGLKREQRKQWRQRYSDRDKIPTLLFKMHECSKALAIENKQSLSGEKAKAVRESLVSAGFLPNKQLPIEKVAELKELKRVLKSIPNTYGMKSPALMVRLEQLVLNIQGSMELHEIAITSKVMSNDEYRSYYEEVKLLQNGLPGAINRRINHCILTSRTMANILSWDVRAVAAPDKVRILLQSTIPSVDSWIQSMRDEISAMIENFILGENLK